jgi:hypothetical protein
MRRGARSLHYLGLKSTYDGCWGAKAPIIAIPFHLKSTFDSPECTYHDAMSCSTWVELPGIGAHTNPSIMMTPALLSFGHLLKVFQRRWSVPSLHSRLEEIFCPPLLLLLPYLLPFISRWIQRQSRRQLDVTTVQWQQRQRPSSHDLG